MKVFNYLSCGKGLAEVYEIYKVVQKLEPYAKTKYKGLWEDALDEAFFHVVENYDSSKGDLEHYATRVVGTILLNKNKKESANTEQLEVSMDLQVAKDFMLYDTQLPSAKETDFDKCLDEMLGVVVKDLKFFLTLSSKDRKMSYRKIFEKYSSDTIQKVQEYLIDTYKGSISRIITYAKMSGIRDFKEGRYLKSVDPGLIYKGKLNGVVLLNKKQGSHNKKVFRVDIREVLDDLVETYYTNNEYGKIEIEDVPVYISMSGVIINDKQELIKTLERELVGSLLARTSLKVVRYKKGVEILLSSAKIEYSEVVLPIFNSEYTVRVDRVVFKEVSEC